MPRARACWSRPRPPPGARPAAASAQASASRPERILARRELTLGERDGPAGLLPLVGEEEGQGPVVDRSGGARQLRDRLDRRVVVGGPGGVARGGPDRVEIAAPGQEVRERHGGDRRRQLVDGLVQVALGGGDARQADPGRVRTGVRGQRVPIGGLGPGNICASHLEVTDADPVPGGTLRAPPLPRRRRQPPPWRRGSPRRCRR